MGEFTDARDFMLLLFAQCFFAALARGATFDLVIIDCMQWLYGVVHSKYLHAQGFNTEEVTRRIGQAVAHYQNNEEDPSRPLITIALVALLDTVHQVPRSKGATQKARDTTGEAVHITEARFNALHSSFGGTIAPPFIGGYGGGTGTEDQKYLLTGDEVWRSDTTKTQLYTAVAKHLLQMPVVRGKVLVVDDAAVLSPQEYTDTFHEVMHQTGFDTRSAFEQDWMMHTHLASCLRRFILYDDGKYLEWPVTDTGEADIKVLHYLRPGNGARRFLVVNQDTDLIFILLLHVPRLLAQFDQDAGELELWLDTHSPNSDAEKGNKPYRYINIVALYHAIVALFAREYPSIMHPVETFCFLFFSRRTDFVAPFSTGCPNKQRHTDCLCIRDEDLWNLFSETHSDPAQPFLQFTKTGTSVRRCSERYWSVKAHGLLNHAVSYDWVRQQFFFMHRTVVKFYYLMFQRKVMSIRHRLRLPVPLSECCDFFAPVRADPVDAAELLIYAHDVAERLEAYRQSEQERHRAQLAQLATKRPAEESEDDSTANKKLKVSARPPRAKLLRQKGPEDDDEVKAGGQKPDPMGRETKRTEMTLERYVAKNGDVLKDFAKFAFKEYHGVPTQEEMLVRLYDIELYMTYCRDGWRMGSRAADMLTDRSAHDDSLSVWPYTARVLTDPEERARALNSSYYVKRYNPENPQWYDLVEVTKTSRVIHRRYLECV